ncbi:hypothetical protein [Parasphingorhabdus sp.]|uniref:hypothetical protein n=1 Tax=Parasphingorhabdus sp. TaxID=2709688 RepID=UPI0030EEBDF3
MRATPALSRWLALALGAASLILATTVGTSDLTNPAISDDVPTDTTYKPESITLEGAPPSDASKDGDAGSFDGGSIAVALDTVPGGQTRTITFQVTIN